MKVEQVICVTVFQMRGTLYHKKRNILSDYRIDSANSYKVKPQYIHTIYTAGKPKYLVLL